MKQIIEGFINLLKYNFNKSYREKQQKLFSERIKICESCEYFWKSGRNCMLCGCFCDMKTKVIYKIDENGKSIKGCKEKNW